VRIIKASRGEEGSSGKKRGVWDNVIKSRIRDFTEVECVQEG